MFLCYRISVFKVERYRLNNPYLSHADLILSISCSKCQLSILQNKFFPSDSTTV